MVPALLEETQETLPYFETTHAEVSPEATPRF